ncbi:MAG: phosphotransferase, partial [Dehalococcoidia bacterium]
MSELPVPAGPEGVTAQWLTDALRRSPSLEGVAVAAVRWEQIAVGEGFAGQLARIAVTYEGDAGSAPATLIGKFASPHEETRALLDLSGGYEREVRFYRELAQDAGLPTARCYHAAYDGDAGTCVMLLEDLSPAETGDQVAGATLEESRFVVVELARFHARWWNDERLLAWEWLRPPAGFGDRVIALFDAGLPAFMERAEEFPRLAALAVRMGAMLPSMMGELEGGFGRRPFTLVHGDMRLDNLFMPAEDGGRFVVIDWQGVTLGAGAADLSYLLALSLDVELRRAHEEELVALYHSTLVEHGVDGYPLSRLKRDYSGALLTLIPFAVVVGSNLDLTSERGQALAGVAFRRMDAALDDHKAGRLLRMAPWALRVGRAWKVLRAPFSSVSP